MRNHFQITSKEWRWAIIAALAVLGLTTLPYLAGYVSQTPEAAFRGTVYDYLDYFHHLGDLNQGARGSWSYELLTTAEPHPGALIRLPHLAIGQLAGLLGLSSSLTYQVARLVFGMAALLSMYRFSASILRPIPHRFVAFPLFALGSGLGWLQIAVGWLPDPGISPVDFWLIDPYGFFGLHTFAHFAIALWLLLEVMIRLPRYMEMGGGQDLLMGLAAGLGLGVVQPTAPLIALSTIGLYVGWRSISARKLDRLGAWAILLLGLIQLPVFTYYLWLFGSHPVWQAFLEQNVTLSPPPLYYLMGLGVLAPFAVWGLYLSVRRPRTDKWRLAAAWAVAALFLAYLPVAFQRRFTLGLMAPISILAAIGFNYGLLPWLRGIRHPPIVAARWRRYRFMAGVVLVLVASISSLTLVLSGSTSVLSTDSELFVPSDLIASIDWLDANHQWSDPIFAAERTGQAIVARIGHRVHLAHPVETVDYHRKLENVLAFYSLDATDADRRAQLVECGCKLVVYGPHERALGEWDPNMAWFLEEIYRNGKVVILKAVQ
ncbi:MAG: hypothetical protein ACE5JF_05110 [Anaerolineales bacterium]